MKHENQTKQSSGLPSRPLIGSTASNDETRSVTPPDSAKIMYDALVKIAHSDAFFESEKRLVKIAQRAIEQVTNVR